MGRGVLDEGSALFEYPDSVTTPRLDQIRVTLQTIGTGFLVNQMTVTRRYRIVVVKVCNTICVIYGVVFDSQMVISAAGRLGAFESEVWCQQFIIRGWPRLGQVQRVRVALVNSESRCCGPAGSTKKYAIGH